MNHVATWWVLAAVAPAIVSDVADATIGIWTTPDEVKELPMEGPAWCHLLNKANEPVGIPNISNINDNADTRVMAKALVFARTDEQNYRQEVIQACMAAIGTELGGSTLGLSRNLIGYVIGADLVGLPAAQDATFRAWLTDVRNVVLGNRTLITTHEERPNNWGTHAGASRAAVALYLGDIDDLEAAVTVFKGWLGDRDVYAGFDYGELWWQANPDQPVGINLPGATIAGYPVGGVLPDDQRRSGPLVWPPPQENYVYTALQGVLAMAVILDRQGYDVWNWQDQAILRAFEWLHVHAQYPVAGDDSWQSHVINHHYGDVCLPAPVPAQPGKNVGWTDWTHKGRCCADLDDNGSVGTDEFLALLLAWDTDPGGPPDLDANGTVGTNDLLLLLTAWGDCP